MTLIEYYNATLADNLIACLRLQPDQLILLGEEAQMRAPAKRYAHILQQRGLPIPIRLRHIDSQSLPSITATLQALVRQETDCVIDLTGCGELAAMAVGALISRLEDPSQLSVQKYDIAQDLDISCNPAGKLCKGQPIFLTVQELIALHGGTIHPGSYQPPQNYTVRDLAPLWAIVSAAPRQWNQSISLLRQCEKHSLTSPDITLSLPQLRSTVANFAAKEQNLLDLFYQFRQKGIILGTHNRDLLQYRYCSPLLRFCTEKAGNVLEVKSLLEARSLRDGNGPYFQDMQMGVNIDWDGVIHEEIYRIPETRNEIDLLLIRGATPLFVSCKNGDIGDEELYKLHTVATRFGGPYARKMLIATELDRRSPAANRAFIQRAWDMDIYLVTDAADLSGAEWAQVFQTAMQ